jgi:ABC-type amino acid transport substrate-binding protein
MRGTCLDPALYDLEETGANILFFTESENLDEVAAAIIRGVAETTLLDIPDAMVALQRWPGDIKILGPISESQVMGVAVAKNSPDLLKEFNTFFDKIWKDGTYRALVTKYYPSVFLYLGDFFGQPNE